MKSYRHVFSFCVLGLIVGAALLWPTESPIVFSPGYAVGNAGVLACLLRLAEPEGLPTLLSRENFRRKRGIH